ncbi:MAG: glycosyltransferase [Bacteroidales bacterium]|nr:glycosyltransferase [Bacteroidales bacterium]MDD4655777.1 glycosyltransferase [Bacteroidales bacterium]
MKGVFIHFFDLAEHSGISKKISYQVNAFKNCGVDIDLSYIAIDENGNHSRLWGDTIIKNYGNNIISKFAKWLSFKELTNAILANNVDFIYVRSFYNTNPFLLKMFRSLRKQGVKVVMEFPTYPYDRETKGASLKYRVIFLADKIFRNFLKTSIDRVVTFTDLTEIFGVKTINISNAIDFTQVKVRNPIEKNSGRFNLIGVAEVHYWHGFDRVIKGMANLMSISNTDVHFHIVGDGFPLDMHNLKSLVNECNLNHRVHFYGNLYGAKLDDVFNSAHFAIASLARHRTGITNIKTLKNREYAARGIPFIYSEIDQDFEQMPYILKASPDDSPIDIQTILDFTKDFSMTPLEIRKTIESTLSWDIQMKKVVDQIGMI